MQLIMRFARLGPWTMALAAFAAGALAATGFAPVGQVAGAILGCALWIALLLAGSRRRAWLVGFAFGWAHFLLGLTWIATAFTFQAEMPAWMGIVAVVGLSAFLALYPMLAAVIARAMTARPVPLTLLLAGLFTITEMLRGLLFSGFAWNPLGVAWLQLPAVASLASLMGANGLSALIVLAAGSVVALLGPAHKGRAALAAPVALVALAGVAALALAWWRGPVPPATDTRLLLVQPDVSQAQKQEEGGHRDSLDLLVNLTSAGLQASPVAAVIWPEAAVEYPLEEEPALRARLAALLGKGQILLTGGVAIVRDRQGMPTGATNSLYALDSDGRILMRYDKAHLVPGGEYLPLRRLSELLGLSRLVPGALDFVPGPGPQTFHLPGLPSFGPAICYEIIFPAAIVDRHRRPQFILTVSNDAWFGASGPPQHHAQARLRAIEEGLPVVRVTSTGISGTIGPDGELVATLPAHQPVAQAVSLPAAAPPTVFSRLGLVAPLLWALLLIGAGILARNKT